MERDEFVRQSRRKSADGHGFGRGNEFPGDGRSCFGCGTNWGDGWGDGTLPGAGYINCAGLGAGFGSGSCTGE